MSVKGSAVLLVLVLSSIGVSGGETGGDSDALFQLGDAAAKTYAGLALDCVDRPWPYKTGHVLADKSSLKEPRHFHPVFFGCYDWHSSVHGHWTLVRILASGPDEALAARIRESLESRFTGANFAREAAFFDRPHTRSFERPYGWAWLLRLAQELQTFGEDEQVSRWRAAIAPLEEKIVERYGSYLPKLTWPIRTGVHPNTAFALSMGLDYARAVGNERLEALIVGRARAYYAGDRDAPVDYEPSGEDFFSPSLLEADLMRRVLDQQEFSTWLGAFMPGIAEGELGGLAAPARVSDASDPKIVHLDGLNLVRAWTLDGICSALPTTDGRRARLGSLARKHLRVGVSRVSTGHYEGEHWLASFALYATSRAGLSPAPDQ